MTPTQSDSTCPTCGGRGWHTAGGNDPMACGRCPAGQAWYEAETQAELDDYVQAHDEAGSNA